ARARADLARRTHGELVAAGLPEEILGSLAAFMEELEARFPTAWRLNAAARLAERAATARRPEVQRARLEEARDLLLGAEGEPGVDAAAIERRLAEVEADLARLGEAVIEVSRPADTGTAPVLAADLESAVEGAAASATPLAPRVEVGLQVLPRVHLAMLRGRRAPVHAISVRNVSDDPITGARLTLEADPAFLEGVTVDLPTLPPGEALELGPDRLDGQLRYEPSLLARLTERADGAVVARVHSEDELELGSARGRWELHPADSWPGTSALPEILAAFVLPNAPFVATLLSSAARRLEQAGHETALSGYQSKDPLHALHMVEAVYGALLDAQVSYANPPASFESDGQRVRFPAAIASSRLATCLDVALLAAAALEQAGLHPVLVLTRGHAFVGVWLVERTFSNPLVEEPLRLSKRVELAEVCVFDPTCACQRPSPDFAGAREAAERELMDRDAFQLAVDVARARRGGMLPLPTFAEGGAGRGAEGSGAEGLAPSSAEAARPDRDLEADLRAYLEADRLRREAEDTPQTRLDRWLRQLLDLTMRNRLLNSSSRSKRVVPLLGGKLDAVEDRLADGRTFTVLERPSELAGKGDPDGEAVRSLDALLTAGVAEGQLRSHLEGPELEARLTNVYREARTAREEGGANSLYLAIGFLTFRETRQATRARRAPLLLVPLEMKRRSGRGGYSLVKGGDETRINVTLLEYLRRDHDIDITGLDPLPEDDNGVDVALVLRIVRDAVKDEDGWEVTEEGQVGLYSFSKYLLWRDLRDRADVLRENALVAHLLDRPREPFEEASDAADPAELDARIGARQVFAPLSYDSTQLSAILSAARGRTMVLEGPPGTGKSQTITNLIAHAIAGGQRVLFVSEKMAALDVVHRRLRGLGLGPACLELHSNKANKKGVLEQFKESLEEGRVRGARRRRWEEVTDDVDAARRRLNGHVDALHRERRSGESIHGVIAGHGDAALRGQPLPPGAEALDLALGDPTRVEAGELERWRRALDDLDPVAEEQLVGPDHPLLLVGRTEYSPILEDETRAALVAFDAAAAEFLHAARRALELLGLPSPTTGPGWVQLVAVGRAAMGAPDLGPEGPRVLGGGAVLERAAALLGSATELAALRARFEEAYRAAPSTLDLDALERARRDTLASGLFGLLTRWRGRRALRDAFRGIARDPGSVRNADALRALDEVQRAAALEGELAAAASLDRVALGAGWSAAPADLEACGDHLARVRALAEALATVAPELGVGVEGAAAALLGAWRPDLAAEDGPLAAALADLEPGAAALAGAWEAAVAAAEPLPGTPETWSVADVADLQALTLRWTDRWSDLRGWTRWQTLRAAAIEAGREDMVAALEQGRTAGGEVRAAFDRAYARAWTLHEISADPALKAFDGADHGRAVDRFVALDEERLEAAREEVRQRVGAKRPQPATLREKNRGTALGLLQREITKKTRHLAIRRLLSELGDLAMDLKPCFLMSPMSVAQYLEADHPRFDLVVFDEASQIPVWDGIGAIARGKQAVIVGDPKQLPPTSFFSRSEDEAVEEDEIQDLESILEECIGARVPTQRLAWHYRSRHESLIAFSNERYYDRGLLTFPSNSSEGLGVSSRYVPDGVYDKGRTRTNAVEARAVVAEVVRRLRDADEQRRSIGVVTFSQAQQTLVLDLFDAAVREHPELERFFDEAADEPVFVKNLENVQGDERDVIVFSVGYGPDERGRVSMNFGPLNKEGGERRLNVAVTRAREQVVVFTSIRPDQIDLARTGARAVRDLQAFLRHAERGEGAAVVGPAPQSEAADGLVERVAERLRERGWDVVTGVGASSVRVDLAVRHPARSGRFLAGIETDGDNYARAATARDRDRLRPLVLSGLGWSLLRVWTVDWWRNADAETERLHRALQEALDADPGPGTEVAVPAPDA
ncbi:MAG: DUF4011 domain-containing protein, partial [Planctomycetota bacterium]